jgi:hypothetical protein
MRAQRLDLGMALAAAARGFKVGRYSNPNDTLVMKNGAMILERKRGKSALFSSLRSMDFKSKDWYVISDVSGWEKYEVEG